MLLIIPEIASLPSSSRGRPRAIKKEDNVYDRPEVLTSDAFTTMIIHAFTTRT